MYSCRGACLQLQVLQSKTFVHCRTIHLCHIITSIFLSNILISLNISKILLNISNFYNIECIKQLLNVPSNNY